MAKKYISFITVLLLLVSAVVPTASAAGISKPVTKSDYAKLYYEWLQEGYLIWDGLLDAQMIDWENDGNWTTLITTKNGYDDNGNPQTWTSLLVYSDGQIEELRHLPTSGIPYDETEGVSYDFIALEEDGTYSFISFSTYLAKTQNVSGGAGVHRVSDMYVYSYQGGGEQSAKRDYEYYKASEYVSGWYIEEVAWKTFFLGGEQDVIETGTKTFYDAYRYYTSLPMIYKFIRAGSATFTAETDYQGADRLLALFDSRTLTSPTKQEEIQGISTNQSELRFTSWELFDQGPIIQYEMVNYTDKVDTSYYALVTFSPYLEATNNDSFDRFVSAQAIFFTAENLMPGAKKTGQFTAVFYPEQLAGDYLVNKLIRFDSKEEMTQFSAGIPLTDAYATTEAERRILDNRLAIDWLVNTLGYQFTYYQQNVFQNGSWKTVFKPIN